MLCDISEIGEKFIRSLQDTKWKNVGLHYVCSSVNLMEGRDDRWEAKAKRLSWFLILYDITVGSLSSSICADVDTTLYKPVFD